MFDIIAACAPEAKFSLFQVVVVPDSEDEDQPKGDQWDLIAGISDAVDDGADVLNLSVGLEQNCNGHCSVCREASLVVMEDDVCIVVATGNKEDMNKIEGVHCPAVSDKTIGVGGFVSRCTAPISRDDSSSQWWLENDDIIGPYCGEGGCGNGGECVDYQQEVLWPGNVKFHNAAPDTLAQVFHMNGSSLEDVSPQVGTSFAAPMVSGLLVKILSQLRADGIDPSASEIREAVRLTGNEIDDSEYTKFDASATESSLRNDWF